MIIADKAFLSEIDRKAEARKARILSSETEINYSGKAYYVSNSGNDMNDGLSPETAIASIERVSSLPLEEGDAILFERGGLWRSVSFTVSVDNITVSAYGKGEKPRLYGSQRNAASAALWTRTEHKNIWKYVLPPEHDIGHIVCDGGRVHCIKKCHGHYGFTGEVTQLSADLEFWCDRNDHNTVYFCSEKNPGERFWQIEMSARIHGIANGSRNGLHVDNLCIMYVGAHGIGSGTTNGLRVTNCEFGFIGGGIQYTRADGTDVRFGNGVEIYGHCKDFTVESCYIHDCYDAGVTHQRNSCESDPPILMENVTYKDNLFERCIYSIEYFCDRGECTESIMRHLRYTDNICRFAGGFGWQRPDRVARHVQGGWKGARRNYPAEDYIISGNIFDRSIDTLLSISSMDKKHLPEMRGNTYVQYAGKNYGANFVPYDRYLPFDEETERFIRETKGEADAVVAVVPEYDGMCD